MSKGDELATSREGQFAECANLPGGGHWEENNLMDTDGWELKVVGTRQHFM